MTDASGWRQFLVLDRSAPGVPAEMAFKSGQNAVDPGVWIGWIAGQFGFNPTWCIPTPVPDWRLASRDITAFVRRSPLLTIPIQFEEEAQVDEFLSRYKLYKEEHPNDPIIRAVSPDLAIGASDYCCPDDISGIMLGRRVDARRMVGIDLLSPAERAQLDGHNVNVVIVDSGIDKNCIPAWAEFATGWTPNLPNPITVPYPPGETPAEKSQHSTMMIRNIVDIAPRVRFFDLPLIQPPIYDNLLAFIASARDAYDVMLHDIAAWRQAGTYPGPWVVVNGWGAYDLRREIPLGEYSNNAANTFNLLVNDCVAGSIDVVFCAGNCGAVCPDGRCGPNNIGSGRSILGAASHPRVLSVGAVRVDNACIGYSSQGPGQPGLDTDKPDLCAPSGFAEDDDDFAANTGTSAASAVAAGIVAALRTQWSPDVVPPDQLRSILRASTLPGPPNAPPNDVGAGVINIAIAHRTLNVEYSEQANYHSTELEA